MSSRHIEELSVAEQIGVRRITSRLIDEFAGACNPGEIEQFVSEFLDEMIPSATVTRFLPLLAEHSVRDRVRAYPVPARPRPVLPARLSQTDGAHA